MTDISSEATKKDIAVLTQILEKIITDIETSTGNPICDFGVQLNDANPRQITFKIAFRRGHEFAESVRASVSKQSDPAKPQCFEPG